MSPKKLLLLTVFFLFTFLFGLIPQVNAQTPEIFDLTVSPQHFDLSTEPKTTIKKKFRIRNNGTDSIELKIEVKTLTSEQDGQAIIKEPVKSDLFTKWVKIKNDGKITALPREWTDIDFEIEVPNDAAFGYYFAFLISPKSTPTQNDIAAAKLTGAIALPVLLNVKKNGAITDGAIFSFKTSSSVYEYLPVNFNTTFENNGNVHIIPRGNIFITDFLGNQVGVIEVNSGLGAILPQSRRTYESTWTDSFISWIEKQKDGKPVLDKRGKPERELKIRWDKVLDLRIGKYTASALVVVSGEQKDTSYEAKTSFTVFPWKIILGVLAIAIFAIVGILAVVITIFKKIKKIFTKK